MVDPVTPNIGLAIPVRGSDTGTWDVPVNGDFTILDQALGGVTSIAASTASPSVTLATSQAQSGIIRVTGTLNTGTGFNITMASIYKSWSIDNQVVGGAGIVTITSTSGASVISVPPGEVTDIVYDGTTLKFKSLGHVGTYLDMAFTVVPAWITRCTVPPYLLCDGSAFNTTTYPALALYLSGGVLPDARGRYRLALDAGTGRVTNAISRMDGATLLAVGGNQSVQNHTHSGTASGVTGTEGAFHDHGYSAPQVSPGLTGGGAFSAVGSGTPATTGSENQVHNHAFSANFTVSAYGNGNNENIPPTYVGGITLIRAA